MGTGDTPGQGQGPHSRVLRVRGPGAEACRDTPAESRAEDCSSDTATGQRPPLSATSRDRRLDVEWG